MEKHVNGLGIDSVRVRKKPWLFRLVPGLLGNYANTICPWIYVPNDVFVDLKKEKPKRITIATLIREEVHLKRQKELGIIWYGIKMVWYKNGMV